MSSDVPVHDEASARRLCVAKIATAHGVKGLVKLHVFAEDVDLLKGKLFTAETGDKTLDIILKNATAKHWLAEVDGIKDRTEAEKLRGTMLYINRADLPEADEDEYYISDLISLSVIDENKKEIGKVIDAQNFGAGDLLEIQPIGAESFYFPFNDDTIIEVSETNITVKIPEGLLD